MSPLPSTSELVALRGIDTCTLANTVETLDPRLRNEGFTNASIRCLFPKLPPLVGYAVPVKIRCSSPPVKGGHYLDRTDWWNYVLSIPAPRVVVVQDVDELPGTGSLLGQIHAAILQSLGCVGAITNGSVRDVPAVEASGFHFFASSLAVSHAYAHIVSFGEEVTVGGLKIQPGDLLHGDMHGILSVPVAVVPQIPVTAEALLKKERRLLAACRAPGFPGEKLRAVIDEIK
jgi:4-hydroxy-4-methyl-2-oxoglutarate aldolase